MTTSRILIHAARIGGLLFTGFMALFALDAFHGVGPLSVQWIGFAMHLLPALLCATIVAISWRRPSRGAWIFLALAVAYAVAAWRHFDWVRLISGLLVVLAMLHFLSARALRRSAGQAH